MTKIKEGDFVVMKFDYIHTKKKGRLAKVTTPHLRDVSVEFADGQRGSYSWYDVEAAEEKSHCICPHCDSVIKPVWCHEGLYFECHMCHMAFREQDYQVQWATWSDDTHHNCID